MVEDPKVEHWNLRNIYPKAMTMPAFSMMMKNISLLMTYLSIIEIVKLILLELETIICPQEIFSHRSLFTVLSNGQMISR